MKKLIAAFMLLSLPQQIAAADDLVRETDTQFEMSQKIRGEGFAAFRAGNQTEALTKMEEALKYRPGNTLLLGYVAFLAAETGALERAKEAAEAYAATGLSPGGAILGKLEEKLAPADWEGLAKKFDTNRAPGGNAKNIATVDTTVRLIEGVAVSPDGTVFVSSVVSGSLYRLDGDEAIEIVDARDHSMGSFFGLAYNQKTESLFATFARVDQTPEITAGEGKTGVAEFSAATGALKKEWVLGGPTDKHQIADIVIAPNDQVYVSDATGKAVYAIDGNKLTKAVDLPTSMSPQGLAYLNGNLYLADYGRGIWKLDTTTGSSALLGRARSMNLIGIDGLSTHAGKLVAIQNGVNPHRVISLDIDADGDTITSVRVLAQALPDFDEPTLGTSVNGNYYFVAGSQWPKFDKDGVVKEGAKLAPTHIMCLCK